MTKTLRNLHRQMSYLTCIILTAISLTLCSCKTPPVPEPPMPAQTAAQTTTPPQSIETAPSILTSLSCAATPLGRYDANVIDQIKNNWYKLVESRPSPNSQPGKVIVTFTLHADGRITDLKIKENTTAPDLGDLCLLAVDRPSPFPPWPAAVVKELGSEIRNITFTFVYK